MLALSALVDGDVQGLEPELAQLELVSATVPAAKLLVCWDPVALNSAKLVEIDSAAKLPTAPTAKRTKMRRQPLITCESPSIRLPLLFVGLSVIGLGAGGPRAASPARSSFQMVR